MEYYTDVLRKYAQFNGRSTRREYWMFVLINLLIHLALYLLYFVGLGFIAYLYALAVIIPNLAVMSRRLHDVGKSGAWIFLIFIPLVGQIILLVMLCREGDRGPNNYGDDPRMQTANIF